jgi:hypothetical protein
MKQTHRPADRATFKVYYANPFNCKRIGDARTIKTSLPAGIFCLELKFSLASNYPGSKDLRAQTDWMSIG